MNIPVFDTNGKEVEKLKLPQQFSEVVREDLVKRAVLVYHANTRQRYGASPDAGMRHSAKLSRKRHDYKGSYGHGISRVPRKILTRRGTRFYWVGAVAPGTVGGRRAHPPKASKRWEKKINKKERRMAIRSALSAAVSPEAVSRRGHRVPKLYPFAFVSQLESLAKTKEVADLFTKLGLQDELSRVAVKKIRAGKGTMRGRKYVQKKGPLIVVSEPCAFFHAARNIPGVEVAFVRQLNAKLLAPGTEPGRLTLFTRSAIELLEKEQLFM